MAWIIQIAEKSNMHQILMNCNGWRQHKSKQRYFSFYKLVDQMIQAHQHLELFKLFSVSHLKRYFLLSSCVQNIFTLYFYQQFDLIAILYIRLREAWVIPSTPSRDGEKGSSLLVDCQMEWLFGSSALKKAQTSLWLFGPQLDSPQTCYPGISFDYFGFQLTLQLFLQ